MQREKSASASAMRTSDVVFAFIWQVLFTSDPVTLLSVSGAVLVMVGVMIIVVFKSKSDVEYAPTQIVSGGEIMNNNNSQFQSNSSRSSSSNILDCVWSKITSSPPISKDTVVMMTRIGNSTLGKTKKSDTGMQYSLVDSIDGDEWKEEDQPEIITEKCNSDKNIF